MTNPLRRDDPQTEKSAAHATDHSQVNEPTWFFEGANQPTREELIARYRKHFNLPDDGEILAALPRSFGKAPAYRDLIAAPRGAGRLQFPSRPKHEELHDRAQSDVTDHAGQGLRRTYVMAALFAMLAGGSVGFVASQAHTIKVQTLAALDFLMPDAATGRNATEPRRVATSVIMKKPVATASLQVEDVAGRINSLIPLVLRAEPAAAEQDLLLKLSGLPDKAYLTSGHKQADKIWSLSLADLKDVKLMVPGPGLPEINVAVAAFERGSGELAAPVKTMTIALSDAIIVPTASPATQSSYAKRASARTDLPAPIPVPMNFGLSLASLQGEARDLISEGDIKLRGGDAAAARQLYERAWASGSAEGAMALARSFDPGVSAQLRPIGAAPDRDLALHWYERAAGAGQKQALDAIARLKAKP